MIPLINLQKLEDVFSQLDIRGVAYGLGAKAPSLDCQPSRIRRIDCSGWVRYGLFQATNGQLTIPDGSWNQREWCEEMTRRGAIRQIANYADTNRYITNKRLFIAFIKPFTNGCGKVGHVWFVSQYDADSDADTMESHGGVGINSRPWNTRTLRNQVFSVYELPTIEGAR